MPAMPKGKDITNSQLAVLIEDRFSKIDVFMENMCDVPKNIRGLQNDMHDVKERLTIVEKWFKP